MTEINQMSEEQLDRRVRVLEKVIEKRDYPECAHEGMIKLLQEVKMFLKQKSNYKTV